jgi:pyruvate kinase
MGFLPLDQARSGRAFQLVATLGPASMHLAGALAQAGATAFRLNASHSTPERLRQALEAIDAAAPGAPVVVDLQGAKMRLGAFAERAIAPGEPVVFALEGGEASDIPLPHPELFAALSPGAVLSADDDRLHFRVERCSAGRVEAVALEGGPLRPRKGVNLLDHPVAQADLSAADCAFVAAARSRAAFAFSFMKDGREAAWLRGRAPGAAVIGKIERREAAEGLAAIASAVDAAWICRGDLGAQLGLAKMASFVASVRPPALPCPILLAGQVLEHLTRGGEVTRSEACHLWDLIDRGYAGVVLSDETAVGVDPVRAVAAAAALIGEML